MPDKLRLRDRTDIASDMVDRMSRSDMVQEVYSNLFDYIDDLGDEEFEEVYENEPLLYKPTLSEMIDKIWDNLTASYATSRTMLPAHHELHDQGLNLKIKLREIKLGVIQ